jgi:hypothetical protein
MSLAPVVGEPPPSAAGTDRAERLAAAGVAAIAVGWLTYTRLYFFLHPRHLTFDPSPFMYLTGRPDPSCGLTRTFAWMWRGDIGRAVAVYPLGPLVFIATFVILAYSIAVIAGRPIRLSLSPRVQRRIVIGALLALGLNWATKLIWLGM